MKITNPELKVVRFASEDVIATSNFVVANTTGGFDIYSGNMISYNDTEKGWQVVLGDYITTLDAAGREAAKSDGSYNPLYEIYNDYYTKGASYVELYTQNAGAASGTDSGDGDSLD